MFLNNRYQDPTTGIFLSVDPLVATTGDPYLYAAGNPTTLSDPSGLSPQDACVGGSKSACVRASVDAGHPQVDPGDLAVDNYVNNGDMFLGQQGAVDRYLCGHGYGSYCLQYGQQRQWANEAFGVFVGQAVLMVKALEWMTGAYAAGIIGPSALGACMINPIACMRIADSGNQLASGDPSSSSFVDDVASTISRQRQLRHVVDTEEWIARGRGGYLNSLDDAQRVLDAAHDGSAQILGPTRNGDLLISFDEVTGFNNNAALGFENQPTHVFIIKGATNPSVGPTSPIAKPAG